MRHLLENQIICGDALKTLKTLPDNFVQCCVTSPPYWGLRNYGVDGQLGLEKTPQEYIDKMVVVFREVRRVLKDDGVLWLNVGDSYAGGGVHAEHHANPGKNQSAKRGCRQGRPVTQGFKPKDLIGIPWMLAFALRDDGWYLRSDIIWNKPNPMPESVKDRPTKAHEYLFLMSKSKRYYYDWQAIAEKIVTPINDNANHTFGVLGGKVDSTPRRKRESGKKQKRPDGWDGRNGSHDILDYSTVTREERKQQRGFKTKDQLPDNQHHGQDVTSNGKRNARSVWTIATEAFPESHFATFPQKLVLPCILAGSRPGDIILDPFAGSGTTGFVAKGNQRKYILIDLSEEYCAMMKRRLGQKELF